MQSIATQMNADIVYVSISIYLLSKRDCHSTFRYNLSLFLLLFLPLSLSFSFFIHSLALALSLLFIFVSLSHSLTLILCLSLLAQFSPPSSFFFLSRFFALTLFCTAHHIYWPIHCFIVRLFTIQARFDREYCFSNIACERSIWMKWTYLEMPKVKKI